jgi:cation diffusion facilitator family transporter
MMASANDSERLLSAEEPLEQVELADVTAKTGSHAHGEAEHPCLAPFLVKKVDGDALGKRKTAVREFHEKQNELIDHFVHLHEHGNTSFPETAEKAGSLSCIRNSQQAATWSLLVNVILLVFKIIAAVLSGSLAIISTVVESAMDLFSGAVFYFVARRINKRTHLYPVGKKRFEPLAVIFVASVMGTAALQVMIVSAQSMVQGPDMPSIDAASIGLVVAVVISKAVLYLACRTIPSPSAQALAADHINDIVSNIVVLASVLIARHVWVYADCIGAIVVSIFIIVNWSGQGMEHVRSLAGHAAPPELLQRLTWIALHHSNHIAKVDTVRGYGFGNDYLVEIDIVLPEDMPLREAHDIGEALQLRAECVAGVERAFVHLDFCTDHKASDEHRDNYHETGHSTTLDYSHLPPHDPPSRPLSVPTSRMQSASALPAVQPVSEAEEHHDRETEA